MIRLDVLDYLPGVLASYPAPSSIDDSAAVSSFADTGMDAVDKTSHVMVMKTLLFLFLLRFEVVCNKVRKRMSFEELTPICSIG